jgi:hypothetical protein
MDDFEVRMEAEGPVEIEKLFERLPITLNVGFPERLGGPGSDTTVIGWAYAYRSKHDGHTTIIMNLNSEASDKLQNLSEVFDLKALGFAGLKRRPQ